MNPKNGSVNKDRNWAEQDRMVDTDDYRASYDSVERTRNYNRKEPLSGVRLSTSEMIFSDPCEQYGEETDDRRVPAYS